MNKTVAHAFKFNVVFNANWPFKKFTSSGETKDQFIAILGQSGAGKSSLFKALAGLLPDIQFAGCFGGHQWHNKSTFNPCVYVSSDFGLFEHLNVRQNLQTVIKHSLRGDKQLYDSIIDDLELAPLLNYGVSQLSGGETQRALIARAMLCGKPILLLDEVLSNIDSGNRKRIITAMTQWHVKYKRYFLLVSHDLSDLKQLCQSALIVRDGELTNLQPLQQNLDKYQQGL